MGRDTAAGDRGSATSGGKFDRLHGREALREREGKASREAVASTVGVAEFTGERRGRIRPAGLHPPTERARGRDDERRAGLEIAGPVALVLVGPTPDDRIERERGPAQRVELAGGGDNDTRASSAPDRVDIAAREVHSVHRRQFIPWIAVVVTPRTAQRAHARDRPLAAAVDVDERPAGRAGVGRSVDVDAPRDEIRARRPPRVVVTEHGVEMRLVGEQGELGCSDATATPRLLPGGVRLDDRAPSGHHIDPCKSSPFDVPDDRDPHARECAARRDRTAIVDDAADRPEEHPLSATPDTAGIPRTQPFTVPGSSAIAFDVIETAIGPLLGAVTDQGLALLAFAAEGDAPLERLARTLGGTTRRNPQALDPTRRELEEYFAGARTVFALGLDLRGLPSFTTRVLGELARVPYGTTATYRDLARRVGSPAATRAVGSVMNRNRIPIVLPCHRIVGATGALTGYAGGLGVKERLLRLEGTIA